MIDTLLELVPLYGLYLIGGVVALSCLAIPLPSSMLVMASGGFAAAGDLVLWQVIAVAFAGFVIGDQAAFYLARWRGRPLLERIRRRPRRAAMLERAEELVARWGGTAVFVARTVLSPLAPWTSYVGGAAGLRWASFTLAALAGAAFWATAYATLGYQFADKISDIAALIVDWAGIILAAAVAVITGVWLWRSWLAYRRESRIAK